jgi:transcriptional regulator with XRE-family HTH domain
MSTLLKMRKVAGKNLKALRLGRGYTQAEISRVMGLRGGFLSTLEAGNRTDGLDAYIGLADFFKVPLWQLFSENALGLGDRPHVNLKDLRRPHRRLVADLVRELKATPK